MDTSVSPSPNIPSPATALVYPGQCLLEGTNVSEGRGTTRPFELCGLPGLDAVALADRLGGEGLPGVVFRPVWYRPTFQKHAGQACGGVQIHVRDRNVFEPVIAGIAIVKTAFDEAGLLEAVARLLGESSDVDKHSRRAAHAKAAAVRAQPVGAGAI